MRPERLIAEPDGFSGIDRASIRVLTPQEERTLLRELGACKERLAEALSDPGPPGCGPREACEPYQHQEGLAHSIAQIDENQPRMEARLGAVYQQYKELRSRIALANLRLVAHVAKRFQYRGVPQGDLMQEGFCGLLEAIDRFDLNHETKLSTYATWWIRQAMQSAVASGAYPVKLSPRHLRQLAQNQHRIADQPLDKVNHTTELPPPLSTSSSQGPSSELIRRIHTATRPPVSLDSSASAERGSSPLLSMSAPESDRTRDVDTEETLELLLDALRPREKQVITLRFGLGDSPRLSLNQVGSILKVSKERVRQIQDRALEKLRAFAAEHHLQEAMPFA